MAIDATCDGIFSSKLYPGVVMKARSWFLKKYCPFH